MNRSDVAENAPNQVFYRSIAATPTGDPPAGDPPTGDPPAGDPPMGEGQNDCCEGQSEIYS
jgi:hypothetical protein